MSNIDAAVFAVIDCSLPPGHPQHVTMKAMTGRQQRAWEADRRRAAAEAANLNMEQLRAERDRRLASSDWTELPSAANRVDADAWAEYRQALRDLPAAVEDPDDPVWPTPPG